MTCRRSSLYLKRRRGPRGCPCSGVREKVVLSVDYSKRKDRCPGPYEKGGAVVDPKMKSSSSKGKRVALHAATGEGALVGRRLILAGKEGKDASDVPPTPTAQSARTVTVIEHLFLFRKTTRRWRHRKMQMASDGDGKLRHNSVAHRERERDYPVCDKKKALRPVRKRLNLVTPLVGL